MLYSIHLTKIDIIKHIQIIIVHTIKSIVRRVAIKLSKLSICDNF